LKLNGTYQGLVYVKGFTVLDGSVHAMKYSPGLIVARKEIGLELNVGKTRYIVMSRDQNAGRSQIIKIENRTFESVKHFVYLRKTLTSPNYIQEEIKSRLNLGNAC